MKHYIVTVTIEMEACHEEGAYNTVKEWLNDSDIPSYAEVDVAEETE